MNNNGLEIMVVAIETITNINFLLVLSEYLRELSVRKLNDSEITKTRLENSVHRLGFSMKIKLNG